MNTPTHILVGMAVLARGGATWRNIAVLCGAVVPDLSIYVLLVWSKLRGVPDWMIWREVYWQEPWQSVSAISNSVPLYVGLLLAGRYWRADLVWVFAAAALFHMGLDFPFHNSDAHKHFWPLADWRFNSPLSYWDHRHFGSYVGIFEIMVALICVAVLWRRFSGWQARSLLAMALVTYVAVPAYFAFTLGG